MGGRAQNGSGNLQLFRARRISVAHVGFLSGEQRVYPRFSREAGTIYLEKHTELFAGSEGIPKHSGIGRNRFFQGTGAVILRFR